MDKESAIDVDKSERVNFVHVGEFWVCKICHPKAGPDFDVDSVPKTGRGRPGIVSVGNLTVQKRHMDEHKAKEDQSKAKLQQKVLQPLERAHVEELAWFLASGGCSFSAIARPYGKILRKAFSDAKLPASKRGATRAVTSTADAWRNLLKGTGACTLALDGGTCVRRCFLNYTIGLEKGVYFWRSIGVKDFKAATITGVTKNIVDELRALGVFVVAIVSDNASAMIKALGPKCGREEGEEEEEEDEAGAEGSDSDSESEGDEWEPAEVAQELAQSEHFSGMCHIRCWSHSFQLLLHDVMRGTICRVAVAATQRVAPKLTSRAGKAAFHAALKSSGKEPFCIHVPCVTRWNSLVKTMADIHHNFAEANVVLKNDAMKEEEVYAMSIALAVALPISWACDVSQSDETTVANAGNILSQLVEHFGFLEKIAFSSDKVKNDVKATCSDAKRAIEIRTERNFCNDMAEALAFLRGQKSRLTPRNLATLISKSWSIRGVTHDIDDIHIHLERFVLCPTDGIDQPVRYWLANCSAVGLFLVDIQKTLVSEASVERSFSLQSKIRPDRWRLSDKVRSSLLFVARNAPIFRKQPPAPKELNRIVREKKANIRSIDEWKAHCLTLCEPTGTKITRGRAALTSAMGLGRCDRIEVAFDETQHGNRTGRKIWYQATVLSGSDGEYNVVYDVAPGSKEKEKIVRFCPLKEDKEWRLVQKASTE